MYKLDYNLNRYYSITNLKKVHNKIDHSKTTCFARLHVFVIGMIAFGHGDVKQANYSLDLHPPDSNHKVGSFAKLFNDLERLLPMSFGILFHHSCNASLFQDILQGKEICVDSLEWMNLQKYLHLHCLQY